MVEDHIEHDFDALAVKRAHHLLHLGDLHALGSRRCVAGFRCKEPHRAVAPVIAQCLAICGIRAEVLGFVEFKDRHELDAIHAEARKVFHFFSQAGKCSRIFHLGGLMARESTQVHFVNDEVARRHMRDAIRFEQARAHRHPRTEDRLMGCFRLGHPFLAAHDFARIRIQEDF